MELDILFIKFVKMTRQITVIFFLMLCKGWNAQLFVSRDTISVLENGYTLKMPWANGINFSNISNIDLNFDGKKDLVAFDRINQFGIGRFRCFIKTGTAGQTTYSTNPNLSYNFPQVANWAVCLDYNCDGKEDIFCSTSAGIMVYKNISTPLNGINFVLVKPLIYTNYLPTIGNLYANANAVPGISDIDGDGDLDILTFSPQGVFIEYHKNLSKETYGHCDSLIYELGTGCWGKAIENNCSFSFSQTCVFKPGSVYTPTVTNNAKTLHAGSCLTCMDSDGDGDKDLIIGDISCNVIQYAHNTGSSSIAELTDTTKLYPNFPVKGNTTGIKLNNFPCAYYVDTDGDIKTDLVATPNANGSENYQSVWLYRNASATSTVDFQFVKKNFLQDEMIEVGQNSFPVLFDYDSDGKKDLLIGTYGYYQGNSLKAKLTLYRNTGTLAQPSFSLITRDYIGLSTYSLNTIVPTVGDFDGDGDIDMMIGTQSGQIYKLTNTAGPGAVCNFSYHPTPLFTTISAAAAPQLFDINQDGLLDLMIGGKNGRIGYYRNIGTASNPSFTLTNSFFGGVDVKGEQNLYGLDGYSTPFFYTDGGNIKLLTGCVSGKVYYYSVPSSTTNCVLLNQNTNSFNEGAQSTVYFEDINNDNLRDLFIGNGSGGLSFFSSMGPDVSVKDLNNDLVNFVKVFPNPSNGLLNVSIEIQGFERGELSVKDILSKEVYVKEMNSNFEQLNISELPKGIYFLQINASGNKKNFVTTKKIIKE